MSERIEKVFSPSSSGGRRDGWVQRRNDDGSYVVMTGTGEKLRAESPEVYWRGERVTVLQGRILGRTGGGVTKIVEV